MLSASCESIGTSTAGDRAALANARLAAQPYRRLREVACECHEGLLILRGVVESFYLKQVAQAAVSDLSGVYEIVNRIEVQYTPRESNGANG